MSSSPRLDFPYGVVPPDYRLPAESRVGIVRLLVSDLRRSVDYYERVVGFRVLDRADRRVVLGPENEHRPLLELHTGPNVRPLASRRGFLGLYHFAILLPTRADLGRFLRHLSLLGVRAGMSDHLVSEAIYLHDPDNLGIEVYSDRPRSAWRWQGAELEMATDPLDVADLLQAGGSEPWTGLPPGTVIGHVHLHVGDLEAASAFYHAGLGFDRMVWSYPGALFLSAGGYHHHLGTNTWAGAAPSPGPLDARLLEWEIVVPTALDVTEAIDHLEQSGQRVARDPAGGGAVGIDPWGTTVRVRV
jgi:catechol 2,3-dioxygenase